MLLHLRQPTAPRRGPLLAAKPFGRVTAENKEDDEKSKEERDAEAEAEA